MKPIYLIADDDHDLHALVGRAFVKAGVSCTLRFVADGEETIRYLLGQGRYHDRSAFPFPALLLLDLKMPRKDGIETLTDIRRSSLCADSWW